MSNKLEAALGGAANTFTDSEGDVYVVEAGEWAGEPTIKLWVSESTQEVIFYKADATKIIALIAEAAK